MAKYEKFFREEVKDGAIYLHLKDPSMKKMFRIEKAAGPLPEILHSCYILNDQEYFSPHPFHILITLRTLSASQFLHVRLTYHSSRLQEVGYTRMTNKPFFLVSKARGQEKILEFARYLSPEETFLSGLWPELTSAQRILASRKCFALPLPT